MRPSVLSAALVGLSLGGPAAWAADPSAMPADPAGAAGASTEGAPATPAPATEAPTLTMPTAPIEAPPSLPGDLQAQIDALKAEIAALRAESALRPATDAMARELAPAPTPAPKPPPAAGTRPGLSLGDLDGFHVDFSGYYRVRGHVYGLKPGPEAPVKGGLFKEQPTSGRFMNMRLRTGIRFAWKDTVSMNVHIQALDNVIFGDNAGLSSVALFGEDGSATQITGLEAPPIQVFRAWAEAKLPIGVVRVGRQSSHWGLGLLANHGDGFDDDFGENYYGNQFDRFLFGTNPVSIVQAITKKEETRTIPLTLAIAVDRLVEDPLQQYYGVKCSSGISEADDPGRYNAACDRDGNGVTDLEHDYIEDRDPADRPDDWWVDQKDDVWEMVYALIYRGVDEPWLGGEGDFTLGGYVIHRLQDETGSNVVVPDLYLDANYKGVGVQFEGVGIFGKSRALSLPDSTAEDPLAKKVGIFGYAARLYYQQPMWKVLFESGFASGDNQVNDGQFTGRNLHPDYNVGLVLYEDVLARVTANLWGENAKGLRSKGGVYDSHYLFPRVYAYPIKGLEVVAGALLAFPHKADGAIIRCTEADQEKWGCATADATRSMIGQEFDLALKYRYADHFLLSLETGYAHVSDRVALAAAGLNVNERGFGNFWTFQSRMAFEF